MNTMIIAVVLASLVVLSVHADSQEQGGSQEDYGRCSCITRYTSNACSTNIGTNAIGCPNTNSYLVCTNTNCSVKACDGLQVWNAVSNTCAECPAGQTLNYNQMKCICKQGTTFSRATQTCVPCATGSVATREGCGCPRGLILDRTQNICTQCPSTAPLRREEGCQCTDATLFWSQATFSCASCPGQLQQQQARRGQVKYACLCTGVNQFFDDDNVKCVTCPAGSVASREGCRCNIYQQAYNELTGLCQCKLGMALNAAQNACVQVTAAVPVAPAKLP